MTRGSPYSRPFRPRRWALLLLLAAGVAVAADLFLPAGPFPPRERHVVLVRRGQTLREVGHELERVGLLRGTLGFQILARLMHLDRSIKAGQYSFRLGITVPALLHAFARGMSGLSLITIPEGLTTAEISVLLSNRLGVPIADFDSLAHQRAFLDSLGVAAPSIEGYLAPDTYEFLPGTSPEVAFRTMAAHQREVLLRAAAGRDSLPLSMSLHQILTLASIVDSEAQENDERPRIARVYLNRLQRHMRLQADPTVGYGLGLRPRSRLYLRQLRSDTPFNTYLFEGLPPGPICNPGRASVDAVINPQPGVNDLYFVARGNGRHFFAETYQQHLRNIAIAHSLIAGAGAAEPLEAHADTVAVPATQLAPETDSTGAPLKAPGTTGAKALAASGTKAPAATASKEPAATGTKTSATTSTKSPAATSTKTPATASTKAPATTSTKTPATASTKTPATKSTKSSATKSAKSTTTGTKTSAPTGTKASATTTTKSSATTGTKASDTTSTKPLHKTTKKSHAKKPTASHPATTSPS
jgi:UPF0755 protein